MTTKDKILKSSLKLFTKQGIDRTSTAQIAKDAGIASGTLFVHFETKQDLIDELYISIKKNAFFNLGSIISLKDSPEVNIKRLSKGLIKYFLENYEEFIFIGLVENDPQVSKKAVKVAKDGYKDVVFAVEKWQKDGDLKKLDIQLLGSVIWSVIASIVRHCKASGIRRPKGSYLDLVWEALKK